MILLKLKNLYKMLKPTFQKVIGVNGAVNGYWFHWLFFDIFTKPRPSIGLSVGVIDGFCLLSIAIFLPYLCISVNILMPDKMYKWLDQNATIIPKRATPKPYPSLDKDPWDETLTSMGTRSEN